MHDATNTEVLEDPSPVTPVKEDPEGRRLLFSFFQHLATLTSGVFVLLLAMMQRPNAIAASSVFAKVFWLLSGSILLCLVMMGYIANSRLPNRTITGIGVGAGIASFAYIFYHVLGLAAHCYEMIRSAG